MARRRKAREALLRALYLGECRELTVDQAFAEMEGVDHDIERLGDNPDELSMEPFGLGLDDELKEYALQLGRKIQLKKEDFNEHIRKALVNWDFERVSRIDRYIMWIALAEMMYMLDVPVRVSIDEALELAKTYSSEKSPGFINGVLDTAARTLGVLK